MFSVLSQYNIKNKTYHTTCPSNGTVKVEISDKTYHKTQRQKNSNHDYRKLNSATMSGKLSRVNSHNEQASTEQN